MNIQATVLFDLDDTVCLGREPAYDFARRVAADLAPEAARQLLAALDAYCAGKPTTASTFDATDPYHAVRRLARENGVPTEQWQASWRTTRTRLAQGRIDVHPPVGLRELIWSLPRGVETVLVTNSPGEGIEGIITHLGLDGLFDEVIGDAGKPDGMEAILDARLDGREPETLLSIGDIPRNDLIPAADRGCATAYVDHFGRPWDRADAAAATTAELFPFIQQWTAKHAGTETVASDA